MDDERVTARPWQHLIAFGFCMLLGWFAFVRGTRVPLLQYADIGFHELGHLLGFMAPPMIHFIMGSLTQVGVPTGLAVYFFLRRQDLAGGLMLAWAGTAAQDASVYIADAPYQYLPMLFPGTQHDWAYLLGPRGFDAMGSAAEIAKTVWVAGLIMLIVGAIACLLEPIAAWWPDRLRRSAARPAYLAGVPHHGRRDTRTSEGDSAPPAGRIRRHVR